MILKGVMAMDEGWWRRYLVLPEIAELTVLFSMFVTVNALRHNPTVKSESKNAGLGDM